MDTDVIERAALAWVEASKYAGKSAGSYEGTTADEIIEEVAPFSRDPMAYREYERTVVELAVSRLPPRYRHKPSKAGTRLTPGERARIIRLLGLGVPAKDVADLVGRSVPTVYLIRKAVA
jgi:DNA-directed RNA polymerase specialized sigma24 family protein